MGSLVKYKLSLLLLLAAWVLVVGFLGIWYAYSVTTTWEDEGLKTRARTIATIVDPALFTAPWAATEDTHGDGYVDVKDRLQNLKKVNPDLVLYYMVRHNGIIQFIGDSEEPGSQYYSPPGQEYTEAPQDLHDLWKYNKTYVHTYFSDRWGTWTSGFASVVDAHGRVVGVVGIDQDGTMRTVMQYAAIAGVSIVSVLMLLLVFGLYRLARNEDETAALKSDFLGMASHELRSPLSAVRWKLAALMRDMTIPQTVRESLFDMDKHLAHVVSLSSTFLQFTSLDHGLLAENMRKEVPLNQALWSALAKVSIQAEQKKIALWYAKATATLEGVTVFGVEEYVSLAIINVLGNAIKYSPESTQIDIEAWLKDGVVGIAIMDRGPGIPAVEIAKMYKPFMRAKAAVLSGKPGSGFGMYATNKVMKFHKGTIAHTNREGGGTVCTLTFPIHTHTVGL
jgi:signal transduction histidine kinase